MRSFFQRLMTRDTDSGVERARPARSARDRGTSSSTPAAPRSRPSLSARRSSVVATRCATVSVVCPPMSLWARASRAATSSSTRSATTACSLSTSRKSAWSMRSVHDPTSADAVCRWYGSPSVPIAPNSSPGTRISVTVAVPPSVTCDSFTVPSATR